MSTHTALRIISIKLQVSGAIFATVMTLAMLSGIGALASPKVDDAGISAAAQSQSVRS